MKQTYNISYSTNLYVQGCGIATIELEDEEVKALIKAVDYASNPEDFDEGNWQSHKFFISDSDVKKVNEDLYIRIMKVCSDQEEDAKASGVYDDLDEGDWEDEDHEIYITEYYLTNKNVSI